MSTGKDSTARTDGKDGAVVQSHRLVPTVEARLDAPADAYSVVEDGEYAFVVAGWRVDEAVIHSRRFACRVHDETVTQVGVCNTHHVDETTETESWARTFLSGREDRAVTVAREMLTRRGRPPRKPFDGRV